MALTLSVLGRHLHTTRALLGAGADVNARDGAGETPLVIASRVELGMSVRRTVPGLLVPMPWRGISSGSTAAVGEAPGVRRETIRNKEPDLVPLLLDAGADPNAPDRDGLTALMSAAGQGRIGAVEVRGKAAGRVRLQVVPDASARSLTGFVKRAVVPGALILTDRWQAYAPLPDFGYRHRPRTQGTPERAGKLLPHIHRVFSNLKT